MMKRHAIATLLMIALAGIAAGCGTTVPNNPDSVVADITNTVDSDAEIAEQLNCLGGKPVKTIERVTVEALAGELTGAGVAGNLAQLGDGGWLIYGDAPICSAVFALSNMVKLDADGSVEWYDKSETSLMCGDPGHPRLDAVLRDGFVISNISSETDCQSERTPLRFAVRGLHNDHSVWWEIPSVMMGNPIEGELVHKSENDELWYSITYEAVDGNQPVKLMHIDSTGSIADMFQVTSNGGTLLEKAYDDDGVVFVFKRVEQDETQKVLILEAVHILYEETSGEPVELGRWEVPVDTGSFNYTEAIVVPTPDSTATDLMLWISYTLDEHEGSTETLYINPDGSLRWTHEGNWSDHRNTSSMTNCRRLPDGRTAVLDYRPVGMDPLALEYRTIAADGQSDTILNPGMPDPLGLKSWWAVKSWMHIDQGELITGNIPIAYGTFGHQAFVALYEHDFSALKWARSYGDRAFDTTLLKLTDGWALAVTQEVPWPECSDEASYLTMSILLFDSVCGE